MSVQCGCCRASEKKSSHPISVMPKVQEKVFHSAWQCRTFDYPPDSQPSVKWMMTPLYGWWSGGPELLNDQPNHTARSSWPKCMLGQVHHVQLSHHVCVWGGGGYHRVHSRNEVQEAGEWLVGMIPHVAELHHHLLLEPVIDDRHCQW